MRAVIFYLLGQVLASFGAHIWRGGDAVLNQLFKVLFNETAIDKRFFQITANRSEAGGAYWQGARWSGLRHVTRKFWGNSTRLERDSARSLPRSTASPQTRSALAITSIMSRGLWRRYKRALLSAAYRGDLTKQWRRKTARRPRGKSTPWASCTEGGCPPDRSPTRERDRFFGDDVPFSSQLISTQAMMLLLQRETLTP